MCVIEGERRLAQFRYLILCMDRTIRATLRDHFLRDGTTLRTLSCHSIAELYLDGRVSVALELTSRRNLNSPRSPARVKVRNQSPRFRAPVPRHQ